MNLKELTDIIFKDGPITQQAIATDTITGKPIIFNDYSIYGLDLYRWKDLISQCDEFKDVDEIIIMPSPIMQEKNGEPITTKTAKVFGEMDTAITFNKKLYLYAIILTPEIFDPLKIHTPVKDGACITPTQYDPEYFTPYKHIVLTWNPELAQDLQATYSTLEETLDMPRKKLHELLDKVIDNPEEYQVKGERGIMIRGIWNTDIVLEMTDAILVMYMDIPMEGGSIETGMKIIPKHLISKFKEEFDIKKIPTKAELEKFLDENK